MRHPTLLFLYQQQRMNKFKFEPPQEHRRSLQQPKNEHVTTMATLDKCTQILREDRLFLRNEIKNCNQEVLQIFKLFPRQSQLQHLQTRLRKYVQQVKNKLKNEQLARFKETLSSQPVFPQSRLANQPPKPSQSTLKQPLRQAASSELNRSNTRGNRSQDHANHLNMNSSLRHFQDLLKQKLSHEVIEERESENVTSARQGRQEESHSQLRPKPLQQQFFDSVQNKWAGRANNPPSKLGESLTFLKDLGKEKTKSVQELPLMKAGPWEFQKKAKQTLYQFQNIAAQSDPLEEPALCERSREKAGLHEQRDESIFDKHFYGTTTEKSQTPQQNDFFSSISQQVNNPVSLSLKDAPSSSLATSNLYEQRETKWEPNVVNFKLKESVFKQTEGESVNKQAVTGIVGSRVSAPRIENVRKSEDDLFTPLQLLNECRNFLKHRGDSNQKSNVIANPPEISSSSVFHDFKDKLPNAGKQMPAKQEEDSGYVFPQIKDSSKKSEGVGSTQKEDYNYTHFQTFANSLDPRPALLPPTLPIPKHTFQGLQEQQQLPESFSIEDFLEALMESTEMNPFITVKALSTLLSTYSNGDSLRAVFASELSREREEELCLPDLAEAINTRYNNDHETYPHEDKVINSVYDLLDIDQKGFINRDDISAFLAQIEQAEVDNLQEVAQELWRLFEGADFSNQHKLTYWHLYLVKSSEEFERVSQLLGEFEFEIERG